MNFLGSIKLITIGADPEFFIVKNNSPLPSVLFTNNTRKSVSRDKGQFKVFRDNLLIEGNIPPSETVEGFVNNMVTLKNILNGIVKKKGASIISTDAMNFTPRFLAIPDASDFGCSNFFNAWDVMETFHTTIKSHTTPVFRGSLRTAGFHIHLGILYKGIYQNSPAKEDIILENPVTSPSQRLIQFHINRIITRVFDLLITNPSRHIHINKERASGYGSFGTFRITSYGLECRSLGGYFTQEKYLKWIAEQTVRVIKHVNSIIEKDSKALMYFSGHVTLQTINNIHIDPKLYKEFGLDYNKEINKISEISKTISYNTENEKKHKDLHIYASNLSS